ncbi:hypothetical protein [Hydrogenimonas urashimensis]|uniref:hypothetical protein n=1 Tax=Hydrogenimonas urashimensis TaxID=2740515 RepID=UPI0019154596|nr:hypothetical protein [Hydrogenimonas urashimensis]
MEPRDGFEKITIKEYASLTGKSLRTIYYMIERGELTTIKEQNRMYVLVNKNEFSLIQRLEKEVEDLRKEITLLRHEYDMLKSDLETFEKFTKQKFKEILKKLHEK